jgi:Pyridoxamine 5'-phosphate oxidase
MSWSALEVAAPVIAERGQECLDRVGLALLGTLRSDGWPRIGPVEPHVTDGRLLIGVMARSLKARDLARDPRCTLQSVVTHPDSGEPELKLYCRAVEANGGPPGAWWTGRPAAEVHVFELEVEQAAFVEWDVERGEMKVTSWSPADEVRTATRRYP